MNTKSYVKHPMNPSPTPKTIKSFYGNHKRPSLTGGVFMVGFLDGAYGSLGAICVLRGGHL